MPEQELQLLTPWYSQKLSELVRKGKLTIPADTDITALVRMIVIDLSRYSVSLPNRKAMDLVINDALEALCMCPPPLYLLPRNAWTEICILGEEVKQAISAGIRSKSPGFHLFKALGPSKTQQLLKKAMTAVYAEYEVVLKGKTYGKDVYVSDELQTAMASFAALRSYYRKRLYRALKEESSAFNILE